MKNNKSTFKTSWSDNELLELSKRSNHKIVKTVSGNYVWKHFLNDKWSNHSGTECYKTYNKPASFMNYWLVKWSEELTDRNVQANRLYTSNRRKLDKIKNSIVKTTADKIREAKALDLNLTNTELAIELGLNEKTIRRALNGDYTVTTSFPKTRNIKKKDSNKYYNINDTLETRTNSKEYLDYVAKFNSQFSK